MPSGIGCVVGKYVTEISSSLPSVCAALRIVFFIGGLDSSNSLTTLVRPVNFFFVLFCYSFFFCSLVSPNFYQLLNFVLSLSFAPRE